MDLPSRISELSQAGIEFNSSPLTEDDRKFDAPIVVRFDNGEGLEYIDPKSRKKRSASPGVTNALIKSIGKKETEKTFVPGMPGYVVTQENHVILDFRARMKYEFKLPARDYLNMPVEKVRSF